jgi:hypothetical protein
MLLMSPFFDDLNSLRNFEMTTRCQVNIGTYVTPVLNSRYIFYFALACLFLMLCIPRHININYHNVMYVLNDVTSGVSCLFALGVNISNYLVLGKTSPLTYQVAIYIYIYIHIQLDIMQCMIVGALLLKFSMCTLILPILRMHYYMCN